MYSVSYLYELKFFKLQQFQYFAMIFS